MADDQLPLNDEAAEREERLAKLRAERQLVEHQLSVKHQRLELAKVLGPSLAAIVAVAGVLISTSQWYFTNAASRAAQSQERLDRYLEQLAASEATRRITAVALLRPVLSGSDDAAAE